MQYEYEKKINKLTMLSINELECLFLTKQCYLLQRGILVTPEQSKKGTIIQVNRNGIKIKGSKIYKTAKEINEGIKIAVEYEFNKINTN